MLNISTELRNIINQSTTVNANAKVVAEWNQNRYSQGISVIEIGTSSYNAEIFPADSVILPNRPSSGLPKALVDEANTHSFNRLYNYRIASADSPYKYWSSKLQSRNVSPNNFDNAIGLEVNYGAPVYANKVVITFDISWARPDAYQISIKRGSTWTTVSSNVAINSQTGRVVLWYQGGNSWTTNRNINNHVEISGIRVTATSMTRPRSHLNIVEISGRLEKDLSDRIISCSVNKTLNEQDIALPIGRNSSNSASIEIDNSDSAFNNENPSSIYRGLIDKNIEFTISYGINTFGSNPMNSSYEYLQQGMFYSSSWSGDESSYSIDCFDFSTYLQDVMIPPSLFEEMTGAQIVTELLQRAGINLYGIKTNESGTPTVYKYFWIEEEMTLWDAIGEVCKVDQASFYFDEFNIAQYFTRDFYKSNPAVDYAISAERVGSTLPNLEELGEKFEITSNSINIRYKPLKVNEYKDSGVDSSLWNPTDTVALRSAELTVDLSATGTELRLEPAEATNWPYSGMANISGEIVSYDGKGYTVYNSSGTSFTTHKVKSADEKSKLDASSGVHSVKNHFNGWLENLKRGLEGTRAVAHPKRNSLNWTGIVSPTVGTARGGWNPVINIGGMHLNGGGNADIFHLALRGKHLDEHKVYGTRLKINNFSAENEMMGLAVHVQPDFKAGYFFEFVGSNFTNKRTDVMNFRVFKRFGDGTRQGLNGSGVKMQILKDNWYQIDVTSEPGGNWIVSVNGIITATFNDRTFANGRYGVYVRGDTKASADYIYAHTPAQIPDLAEYSMQDRINGGFVSTYIERAVLTRDNYTFVAPKPQPPEGSERLVSGGRLNAGQSLVSRNGHARAIMQHDGNFVVYAQEAIWSTNTAGNPGSYIVMQNDGNLVVYNSNNQPIWASGTATSNQPNSVLIMQDDFNLVIYRTATNSPIWGSLITPIPDPGLDFELLVFDEFGSVVHEMRKFNIEFEKKPALSSSIYLSNDKAEVSEYIHSPFGAEFYLTNTDRRLAIVAGDDDITIPGETINHKILVYGQVIIESEEKTVAIENKDSIRRHGRVELEIESRWIQTEDQAKALGDYFTQNWGTPVDFIEAKIFGNPALQIGDIVSINYPEKNYYPNTHKYIVSGSSLEYSGGLEHNLTLRRVRI